MEKEILLTYCALPSRLRHKTQETYDFVINQGHAPLHPFVAFPEKDYGDLGTFGRDTSLDLALQLVNASSQLYIFGFSEGTMKESFIANREGKNIEIYVKEFDPDWRKYYHDLRKTCGNFLDPLMKRKGLL